MRQFKSKLVLFITLCMVLCCIPFSESFAATIDGVTYTISGGELSKVSGGKPGAELVVPATIGGVTYSVIGFYAFEGTQFSSIVLPDTVKSIGYGCFQNCTQLTTLKLSANLQEMWDCAFWGCSNLESIAIPEGVTALPEHLFYDCINLKSVALPSTLTSIGNSAFKNCTNLCDITLPEGLKSIEEHAFYGCSSLESIVIPEGITTLPESLFLGCSSLKSVSLPSALTSIGNSAFSNCTSLCDIMLPEGLKSIGEWAFYDCTSLPEINSPHSLTSIGDNAFLRCQSLQTVTIPEGVTMIGQGTFADCPELTDIYLHKGITSFSTTAVDGSLKVTIHISSSCPSLQSLINYTIPCQILETGKSYNIIEYVDPSQGSYSNGLKIKAIVNGLIRDWMSDYEKTLLLNNWIMRNITYKLGHPSISHALFEGYGNCVAVTSIFSMLLNEIGIENVEEEGLNHCWNMVKLGGEWYHLDATWNMSSRSWDYFCLSNFAIEPVEDHQCYLKPHVATAYKYNYAYHNGQLDQRIAECQSIIEEKLVAGVTEFAFVPAHFTNNDIDNRTAILVLRSKPFTLNGSPINLQILYDNDSHTVSVSPAKPAMGTPDTILPSITAIESESFRNTDVSIVYVQDGTWGIWDYAFADCSSLREIRIPASVYYIAPTAFQNVKDLRIYGYASSDAQQFAYTYGYDFALLE